jgi:hypothetical protein
MAIATLPAALGNPGTTSTFAFEWRKGMIFVPVRIDGSRPLSFALYTRSTRKAGVVLVGQTIGLCRLPALAEGGRPRKAMVCHTPA